MTMIDDEIILKVVGKNIIIHKRIGFTLIEFLVVIAIIALLMAILITVLQSVKEQGKRAACLSNLKQLMIAWIMYADANEDKIVNGAGGVDRPGEPAWVGQCWGNLTEEEQIREIKKGALWPYLKNVGLYKCPRGYRGETVTYSIVDSMNGFPQPNNVQGRTGTEGLIVKIRTQIRQPSERIVFVDEGFMTPDSYAVYYVNEAWWDDPMVRHSNGATFALADGHSDYIKWKGMETVKWGKNSDRSHSSSKWEPQTPDGKRDLHIVQRGVWSRLGYESSVTP